ncbi:MAG TPA: outer membrane beta-barrel protein [Longimicrobiaceae bacterium]
MMRGAILSAVVLVLGSAAITPVSAQNGFALKGHYIVNSSAAEEARESRQLPDADAFGLGAELVLPVGLGVGISGYTAKSDQEAFDSREFTVLGEVNYFLRLPMLPISPYAGVHAGLGVLDQDNVTDPDLEIQDKRRSQLGYQLGVRFQVTPLIGLDAQWRRMSTSADEDQDDRLERDQVLLGVTVF